MKEIIISPVTRQVKSSAQNKYALDVANGTLAKVGDLLTGTDTQVTFPPGCRSIEFQARQSGDIYAELLTNNNRVAGSGPDVVAAINAALGKLQPVAA